MIRVEKFKESHLPILNDWAKDRGLPEMPIEMLPQTGFIVWMDKLPIVAGFVYFTDSSVAFVENIISNLHSNKEERAIALSRLIMSFKKCIHDMGYSIIYIRSAIPSLLTRFKEEGFQELANNCSLLMRRV